MQKCDNLPSPFPCFARGCVAFSAGGSEEERERELPDASAAETLKLLPEAGSSVHREVAPEEAAYMTGSLCSPPPVHPSVGPLTADEERSVMFIFIHCSLVQPTKKKGRENRILFLK